jgi:hypothetical protein
MEIMDLSEEYNFRPSRAQALKTLICVNCFEIFAHHTAFPNRLILCPACGSVVSTDSDRPQVSDNELRDWKYRLDHLADNPLNCSGTAKL